MKFVKLFVALICGLFLTASCGAEDEPIQEEELAEVQQAVGLGGSCVPRLANCDAGLTCCGSNGSYKCVNTEVNFYHCGSCNNACGLIVEGPATDMCIGGTCYDDTQHEFCTGLPPNACSGNKYCLSPEYSGGDGMVGYSDNWGYCVGPQSCTGPGQGSCPPGASCTPGPAPNYCVTYGSPAGVQ
jgi:hypothetical protein